jgi:hypothetical protein
LMPRTGTFDGTTLGLIYGTRVSILKELVLLVMFDLADLEDRNVRVW